MPGQIAPDAGEPARVDTHWNAASPELYAEIQRQAEALAGQPRREAWDNELVVYIWRNGGISGRMGHASLKIHRSANGRRDRCYVSWWPADGAAGGVGAIFEGRQAGAASGSLRDDKSAEMNERTRARLMRRELTPRAGQQRIVEASAQRVVDATGQVVGTRPMVYIDYLQRPDAKVALPGLGSAPFGLSAYGGAWRFARFVHEDGTYKAASRHHNCAGVVRTVLKGAGAEAFVPAPAASIWCTPNEVQAWSEQLQAKIKTANMRTDAFVLRHRIERQRSVQLLRGWRIPTVEQWRVVSRRPDRTRGQNVRALDEHLQVMTTKTLRDDACAVIKAKLKAFNILERALTRAHRDPHDRALLTALGDLLLHSKPGRSFGTS